MKSGSIPIVDSREPEESIRVPLKLVGWQQQELETGDFSFLESGGSRVLVERKTVGQLLFDLASGQLSRQLNALIAATDWPILVLEGQWVQTNGNLLGTSYTWEQVWNYLQTWQDKGIRLQLTTSPTHTVRRVQELASYYAKDMHESAQRRQPGSVYLDVLCHVKGVGPAKAHRLLERFGDLGGVAIASIDGIMEVPGFPRSLATRVWLFWRNGGKGGPGQ